MIEKIVITIDKDTVTSKTQEQVEAILGPVAWLEYDSTQGCRRNPSVDVIRLNDLPSGQEKLVQN